jgi:xanthine dehydrogenase accessory factor
MSTTDGQHKSILITKAIARILRESSAAVLVTLVVAAKNVGAKMLVEESNTSVGSLGNALLDEAVAQHAREFFLNSRLDAATFAVKDFAPELEESTIARVLFERIAPEPHVLICGAGHVGAALARLARLINYRVTLIDDRAMFVARERFADQKIELVATEDWRATLRRVIGNSGRGMYIAVVTRGHNEDEECLRAILEAQPAYVGLIGSRRRTNIVLQRLREEGFEEERLKKVRAPIGLDIAAVSPEEVALAILAEMIAIRRGGTGRSLSEWRRA